jgi:hypothetical protein
LSDRPLLLLDVDGVLVAVPGLSDDADADPVLTLPPEASEWFVQLAEAFDLMWATTWAELANREIGPRLGLPQLPAIAFSMDERAQTPKLRSVIDSVGDRPCAWVDDDLHEDADTWAAGREAPTLLVHIDAARGMDRRHVDRLLHWAATLHARG